MRKRIPGPEQLKSSELDDLHVKSFSIAPV